MKTSSRFCMLARQASLALLLLLATLPATAQDDLAGQWQLIASPMGVEGEGGIMTSGWDTITFTAIPSADGKTLSCHADKFFSRSGHDYPMDWLLAVEREGDKTRLGWVCDDQQPASSIEFQEPATAYAIGGRDIKEGEHRYLYVLSYNVETGREEAMTLWSGWMNNSQATFTLPQNQQLDVIVSTTIPFSTFLGYADSWASARLQKVSTTGISELVRTVTHADACYDLQGRRLYGQPQRGLLIKGGRKYFPVNR